METNKKVISNIDKKRNERVMKYIKEDTYALIEKIMEDTNNRKGEFVNLLLYMTDLVIGRLLYERFNPETVIDMLSDSFTSSLDWHVKCLRERADKMTNDSKLLNLSDKINQIDKKALN